MRVHAATPPASARIFAWAGAVLFFASLAYFLFTYVTTFGASAADGNAMRAITWNVVLFTLFAGHHSVVARPRVRTWVAQRLPAALERSAYVWVASLLFFAVCALWQPVPGVAWQAEGVALWVLWLLQAAGVWLTLRSAAFLDIRELAGLTFRGAVAGGLPAAAKAPARLAEARARRRQASGPEFKTTGPYGWVRHPIYSGWFLLVFAASPMTMTRLVFAIVSCLYLLIAIPFEERSMRSASSGAYDRYVGQVRWRLLPGVY